MNTYKFQHIRGRDSFGNEKGAITIASKLSNNEFGIPENLEFAVTFCSPKDQFDKKFGREISTIRLENKDSEYYRKIDLRGNRKLKHYEISDLMMAHVFSTMPLPRWTDLYL